MKYLIRLFCVLLCFVCLFTAFSIGASASVVSVPEYTVSINENVTVETDANEVIYDIFNGSVTIDPFNNIQENYSGTHTIKNYKKYDKIETTTTLSITSKNGNYLIRKGGATNVTFSDVMLIYRLDYGSSTYWPAKFYLITVNIYYVDGSIKTLQSKISADGLVSDYDTGVKLHYYSFSFVPEKNVTKIDFICETNVSLSYTGNITYNFRLGEYTDPIGAFVLQVDQENGTDGAGDEVGFWQSVINFFESVLDTIFDLPRLIWGYLSQGFNDLKEIGNNLVSWIGDLTFTDFWDYLDVMLSDFNSRLYEITQLPIKLWEKIGNGIRNLFVPSEEDFNEIFDSFNVYLEDKWGAIYQIIDLFYGSWQDFLEFVPSEDFVISIPRLEIPIGNREYCLFGPYDINLVEQNILSLSLQVICKLATGICCTLLFINGLKKRWERLFGG